ncbi:MAG: hypothetical protein ACE5G2_09240 [Candidatus Krumholzibacteriia bacterium]
MRNIFRMPLGAIGAGLLVVCAAVRPAAGQESFFALEFLGVSEETGDARARGLGVLGVALDDHRTSISLNPASIGGLDDMTLSAMGVSGVRTSRDASLEDEAGLARFPHERVSLPMFGKVVFTTGFVGLRNFHADFALREGEIDGLKYEQRFERDGTLYTVPFGFAGSFGSRVRAGITLDVLLGTVDEAWITDGDSIVGLKSRRRDRMSGRTVTLGLVVHATPWLRLGGTWSPEFTVDRSRQTTLESVRFGSGSAPIRNTSVKKDIRLPQVLRGGATLQLGERWLLTSDYLWREWDAYTGDLYGAEAIGNETRFGGGLEWRRRRLAYRIGASRTTWPQRVGGAELHESVLHLGLGIDLTADRGRLDFALEHAWIGRVDSNGREERTWRFVVSVSGQEIWKRKSPRGR